MHINPGVHQGSRTGRAAVERLFNPVFHVVAKAEYNSEMQNLTEVSRECFDDTCQPIGLLRNYKFALRNATLARSTTSESFENTLQGTILNHDLEWKCGPEMRIVVHGMTRLDCIQLGALRSYWLGGRWSRCAADLCVGKECMRLIRRLGSWLTGYADDV